MRTLLLLLVTGLLIGCGGGADQDPNARGAAGEPETVYARRMIFVGGDKAAPAIVVFDHSALAGAATVERSAGVWRTTTEGWQSLLDLRWSDTPIREPWRLVPHGPFRIMVDDAGEVEALRGRGVFGSFHLARVGSLGEWSRDEPALYRINLGEWLLGSDSVAGLLVDIHPGANSADSASPPAPAELILTDGANFRLVVNAAALPELNSSGAGELWLQRAERTETMAGVSVSRDTVPNVEGWLINARGGELHGELKPLGSPLRLEGGARSASNGMPAPVVVEVVIVQALQGWIVVRGDRREVFGIMRRAPA
jgi:hypothetical protein